MFPRPPAGRDRGLRYPAWDSDGPSGIRDIPLRQVSRFRRLGRRGPMSIMQSRRRFLKNVAWAGAAGLGGVGAASLGGRGKSLAAEPPPEVTTIRFEKDTATCIAPQVAEELLRAEGFTDIRYVEATEAHVSRAAAARSGTVPDMMAHGEVDFG